MPNIASDFTLVLLVSCLFSSSLCYFTVNDNTRNIDIHSSGHLNPRPEANSDIVSHRFVLSRTKSTQAGFDDVIKSSLREGYTLKEAALHAFVPLLKKAVLATDLGQRVLRGNFTRSANKQCVHHLIHAVEAALTGHDWAIKSK
ncbi:hypothetical protein PoB_000287600 [Plakobranchus ocellatus]|uniref:Uncharacterized protein n=1 Tax=Plakobranchus ocellatus TaxID=259542 RepID=A0AAV3XEH1_9GAST|nr:hypothetical protein PoB_000287600 [Plakobranchus ocellatus]